MASPIFQTIFSGLGGSTPIVPDDALLGKATLSRFGTFVYSDIILSLKPDPGEINTASPVSLTGDGKNNITFGNQLGDQISRTINNIKEENFLDGDPDSIRLQEAILRVTTNRIMSKTNIAGSQNNPVVEYFGEGGYTVACDFNLVTNWAKVMPERAMRKLIRILNSKTPITCSSRWLNSFGITRLVIEDHNWAQRAGTVNQQRGQFVATAVTKVDTIDITMGQVA